MQERNSYFSAFPPISLNLIIINIIVWLAQIVLPRFGIDLTGFAGMHYFRAEDFRIWQLFTYAFLHDPNGFSHVFFNMFALLMFGASIERLFRGKRFLLYYVVCVLSAAITQQIVWAIDLYPIASLEAPSVSMGAREVAMNVFLNRFITLGASGAIFGILLAFGWFFPNAPIFLMFIPIPIKAKYFVIIYGILELFGGIQSTGDGVAHFAHVGGMVGGLLLILLWHQKTKEHRESMKWKERGFR